MVLVFPPFRPTPLIDALEALMQEISLTWVPGTLDTVRARLGQRTIEISSTRLARILGLRP